MVDCTVCGHYIMTLGEENVYKQKKLLYFSDALTQSPSSISEGVVVIAVWFLQSAVTVLWHIGMIIEYRPVIALFQSSIWVCKPGWEAVIYYFTVCGLYIMTHGEENDYKPVKVLFQWSSDKESVIDFRRCRCNLCLVQSAVTVLWQTEGHRL